MNLTVDFGGAKISDVYAFSAGTLPDFVQNWEKPLERADILLNSSHSDDDQLFFAGLLPYYASRGCDIQVVYYTDHKNETAPPSRAFKRTLDGGYKILPCYK